MPLCLAFHYLHHVKQRDNDSKITTGWASTRVRAASKRRIDHVE
jgi:hypothetical protein